MVIPEPHVPDFRRAYWAATLGKPAAVAIRVSITDIQIPPYADR